MVGRCLEDSGGRKNQPRRRQGTHTQRLEEGHSSDDVLHRHREVGELGERAPNLRSEKNLCLG